MKINFAKRIIIVGIIGIVICVLYLYNFCAENKISFSNSESEIHFEIIEEELMQIVDMCECIDSCENGNWFAYYVYADGDIYVITLKNNVIDVCYQLN